MKKIPTYKIVRKNMNVIKQLQLWLNQHQRFQNCYFWSPPGSASQRRGMEFEHDIEFILNGVHYDIQQEVRCSCRNVYYSSLITVDGDKKDVRAVKKLLKQAGVEL